MQEMNKKTRENPYLPFNAIIKRIDDLNKESKSYVLDSPELHSMHFVPGQFMAVTVYGVGESIIGVTNSMYDVEKDGFELAVRNVGGLVTEKLHQQLKVGDIIGLRGPYGNGFPVNAAKGKNIIFICAGIGLWPVRSAIKHVLHNRADYGKLKIIMGCREPCLYSYLKDIEEWQNRTDVEVERTVDACVEADDWQGEVGLITKLTDKLTISDPQDWVVFCCGPPIAFKFIGKSLNTRGFNDDQIYFSLERKMKCGIGKCNHCLIAGTTYVCVDGPVFTLGEAKNMPGGMD